MEADEPGSESETQRREKGSESQGLIYCLNMQERMTEPRSDHGQVQKPENTGQTSLKLRSTTGLFRPPGRHLGGAAKKPGETRVLSRALTGQTTHLSMITSKIRDKSELNNIDFPAERCLKRQFSTGSPPLSMWTQLDSSVTIGLNPPGLMLVSTVCFGHKKTIMTF